MGRGMKQEREVKWTYCKICLDIEKMLCKFLVVCFQIEFVRLDVPSFVLALRVARGWLSDCTDTLLIYFIIVIIICLMNNIINIIINIIIIIIVIMVIYSKLPC